MWYTMYQKTQFLFKEKQFSASYDLQEKVMEILVPMLSSRILDTFEDDLAVSIKKDWTR